MNFNKEPTELQSWATKNTDPLIDQAIENIREFTGTITSENGPSASREATEISHIYILWSLQKASKLSDCSETRLAIAAANLLIALDENKYPLPNEEILRHINDNLKATNHPSITRIKRRLAEITAINPTSPDAQIYIFPDQKISDPQD